MYMLFAFSGLQQKKILDLPGIASPGPVRRTRNETACRNGQYPAKPESSQTDGKEK